MWLSALISTGRELGTAHQFIARKPAFGQTQQAQGVLLVIAAAKGLCSIPMRILEGYWHAGGAFSS